MIFTFEQAQIINQLFSKGNKKKISDKILSIKENSNDEEISEWLDDILKLLNSITDNQLRQLQNDIPIPDIGYQI